MFWKGIFIGSSALSATFRADTGHQSLVKALVYSDNLAGLEPSNMIQDTLLLEFLGKLLLVLREMVPRFKVHGHQDVCFNVAQEASSLMAIHGNLEFILRITWLTIVIETLESGFAKVHESDGDIVFLRHLGQLFNINRITGEVDGVRATIRGHTKVLSVNDEANALVARPMLTRRRGDVERLAADINIFFFPVLETERAWSRSEVLCAVIRGENVSSIEKLATELIEVVGVVLVTQENSVDVWKLVHLDGRIIMDLERSGSWNRGPFRASWRKEGIGEEVDAVDAQDSGGRADVSDFHFILES